MDIYKQEVLDYLDRSEFSGLFTQTLGWDFPPGNQSVVAEGYAYELIAVAEKRGMVVYECTPDAEGCVPLSATRRKIDAETRKLTHEHILIFTDTERTTQVWQWIDHTPGQPTRTIEHSVHPNHAGEALAQRLIGLVFTLEDEEALMLPDVTGRVRQSLSVERVTRRFYDRFKQEHATFLQFIEGIGTQGDREWYASIMLNRLMFLYFIQKKGFLDNNLNYLRDRLQMVQQSHGNDHFLSFYRYFLTRLMHEGLNQLKQKRQPDLDQLIGDVPYLNGGIFEPHPLENEYGDTDIPDQAFEKVFDFFDEYQWHLDDRPLRNDQEINPDVLGYIFEKYINQKQMGAYYTKEDITEYISKNTILPFLFDTAKKQCPSAFEGEGSFWQRLIDDPDRYLYTAVRKGVIDDSGQVIALPAEIEAGLGDVSKRDGWNKSADSAYALPTETWREHVARRRRCLEIRNKLQKGEVDSINDFITLNLDIRQFAQDVVEHCDDPNILRAFYDAISTVTVLDPTCGSGAFLFAALNILEPLYEASLMRMQHLVDDLDRSGEGDSPEKYQDLRDILSKADEHPNRAYFIYKTIILNNLFGVDIMAEATEICKLRLFLKLVSQISEVDHLEPLPDIEFNIRTGNTLVGFATFEDVKQVLQTDLIKQKELPKIQERAEIVDRAFKQFRQQQTELGGEVTVEHKEELRRRLTDLENELNRYLATEYGIYPEKKPKDYKRWLDTHKPFHWFVDFYGILESGGFDVIIGNPPYVELRTITGYQKMEYSCESTGNIYALVIERCYSLVHSSGHQGFIVPVSSVSTDRYYALQQLLSSRELWYCSFDDRPSRLFDGLEHIRLTIHLIGHELSNPYFFSTRYNKWNAEEREVLFDQLQLSSSCQALVRNSLPKITSEIEISIINKLVDQQLCLSSFYAHDDKYRVFYSRKVGYFLQVLDFEPKVLDGTGQRRPPSEFKELKFSNKELAQLALCCRATYEIFP